MKILVATSILLSLLAFSAQARPVSWPGGKTFETMNHGTHNSATLHYTPSPRYSVGYKGEYWREKDWWFNGLQVNYLVARHNGEASQANLYIKGAAGLANSDAGTHHDEREAAGFIELDADWETRRWFTSYMARALDAGNIDRFAMQSARVGVAPYLGDAGDVHTWLMLQIDHKPTAKHAITATPLVRLFYDRHMLETGISQYGDVMVNYVIRF